MTTGRIPWILLRNTILILVLLGMGAYFYSRETPNKEAAALCITNAVALIMHSGRSRQNIDAGPSAIVPIACMASLAFGACSGRSGDFLYEVGARVASGQPAAGPSIRTSGFEVMGGINSDYVRLTGQGSLPAACASPYGCLYYDTVTALPTLVDASANKYTAGTAWRARTSAGTPGDVATSWIWYDSVSDTFVARTSGGNATIVGSGGNVTISGTQTITGDKTFDGALVLPRATAPAQTADASIVWDSNDDLLTVGDGASRKTMVDLTTAQTLTNKTLTTPAISSPALSGTSTGAGLIAIANGGTGAATTSQNYVFAGPASGSGAPGFRALVAGDLPSGTSLAILGAGATTAVAGGQTNYLTSAGVAGQTTDIPIAQGNVTRAATIQKLYCSAETSPGGGQTETFTVRRYNGGAWADTSVTCQVSGGSSPATCNDTTHTQAVVAGDRLGISAAQSAASTAAAVTCTFELAF